MGPSARSSGQSNMGLARTPQTYVEAELASILRPNKDEQACQGCPQSTFHHMQCRTHIPILRRSRRHLPAVVARDRTRWTTLMWRKTISPGPLPRIGSLQLAGLVLYPEPTEEVRHVPIGCRSSVATRFQCRVELASRTNLIWWPVELASRT